MENNMEEIKTNAQTKLSYEELTDYAKNLASENKGLKEALTQANQIIGSIQSQVSRMDVGFKILENAIHFDNDTIKKVVKEITELLFPVENNTEVNE